MIVIEGMKPKAMFPDKEPAFRWDGRDYNGEDNLKRAITMKYPFLSKDKDIIVKATSTMSLDSTRDEYLVINVKPVDREDAPDPVIQLLKEHSETLDKMSADLKRLQNIVSQLVGHVIVFAKSFDELKEKTDDDKED